MATAFTHAAVGLTLGQLLPREFPIRRLSLFLALVSVLPDIDVLAFPLGIPYSDPFGHRGFTHSILFAMVLATCTALVLYVSRAGRGLGCMAVGAVTFVSVVSHGILDAATDAGLGIGFFIPFDYERHFLPFRPLETSAVDPRVFLAHPSRALDILTNELAWVGLPLLGFTLILQGFRFVSKVFSGKASAKSA